jgi:hypothetical protein
MYTVIIIAEYSYESIIAPSSDRRHFEVRAIVQPRALGLLRRAIHWRCRRKVALQAWAVRSRKALGKCGRFNRDKKAGTGQTNLKSSETLQICQICWDDAVKTFWQNIRWNNETVCVCDTAHSGCRLLLATYTTPSWCFSGGKDAPSKRWKAAQQLRLTSHQTTVHTRVISRSVDATSSRNHRNISQSLFHIKKCTKWHPSSNFAPAGAGLHTLVVALPC